MALVGLLVLLPGCLDAPAEADAPFAGPGDLVLHAVPTQGMFAAWDDVILLADVTNVRPHELAVWLAGPAQPDLFRLQATGPDGPFEGTYKALRDMQVTEAGRMAAGATHRHTLVFDDFVWTDGRTMARPHSPGEYRMVASIQLGPLAVSNETVVRLV